MAPGTRHQAPENSRIGLRERGSGGSKKVKTTNHHKCFPTYPRAPVRVEGMISKQLSISGTPV